jgi:hypothetical protein
VLSFFFFVGCGFMFLEIGLIDKLVFVLGNSSYSIAFCVAELLVGAGIGSRLSMSLEGLGERRRGLTANSCISLVIVALSFMYRWAHTLLVMVMPLATPLQYAVLTPVVVLLGVLLGIPLPQGLAFVGTRAPAWIPWAWGINCAASVLAINSVGLLYGSLHLSTTFLIAAVSYSFAIAALNVFLLPFVSLR